MWCDVSVNANANVIQCNVCMYVCMYVSMDVCMYVCMHVCMLHKLYIMFVCICPVEHSLASNWDLSISVIWWRLADAGVTFKLSLQPGSCWTFEPQDKQKTCAMCKSFFPGGSQKSPKIVESNVNIPVPRNIVGSELNHAEPTQERTGPWTERGPKGGVGDSLVKFPSLQGSS